METAEQGIALAARVGLSRTYGAYLTGNLVESLFRLGRWAEAERAALEAQAGAPEGTVGIVLGRVGCYSVGEHLGATTTSFFLATRYDGGATREGPPAIGQAVERHHGTGAFSGGGDPRRGGAVVTA